MKILAWVPLFVGTVLFIKLPLPYNFICWMIGAVLTDNLRLEFDPQRGPTPPIVRQLRWWGWILGLASFFRFIPSKLCLIGFVACLTLSRLLTPECPPPKKG